MTEKQDSERRQEDIRARSQLFIEALDVDELIAHLLVSEGFSTLEEITGVATEELASIEGFDDDIATELQARAAAYIEQRDVAFEEQRKTMGVADDVAALPGITPGLLVKLGEKGLKTLDDVGDLASDELLEIAGTDSGLDEAQANDIIMAARAHWFTDEEAGA
jgi:N utilization substance protein A